MRKQPLNQTLGRAAPARRFGPPSNRGLYGRRRKASVPLVARLVEALGPGLAVVRLGWAALLLLCMMPAVKAQESSAQPAPADVYLAVVALQVDLEALRWVQDGPPGEERETDRPSRAVLNAPSRHVFWQAQGLYRRTKELVDRMAEGADLPLDADAWNQPTPRPVPEGRAITSADALQVVRDAGAQLRALLALRNINVAVVGLQRQADKSNLDALAKAAEVNLHIDLLLQREFRPQDAYDAVLLAVDRAGDLLDGSYPAQPALDTDTEASDVHRRLLDCLGLLQSVQRARNMEVLDLDPAEELGGEVPAANLHDLAASLAADLGYMAQRSGAQRRPLPRGEYRMPTSPSYAHVHRLAGALEAQLRLLAGGSVSAG